MFAAIARFDVRFRWVIVVVWVAGAIAGIRLLPSLSSVTQPSNTQFLSSSAPRPGCESGRMAETDIPPDLAAEGRQGAQA
jgi:hypothetical protein